MNLDNLRRDWEELATLDPYWAVLSRPGMENGKWRRSEFDFTGVNHVLWLRERLFYLGLPIRSKSVLDFGCGVGRLTSPLCLMGGASMRLIGTDISHEMIAQARKNYPTSPMEFHQNGETLEEYDDGTFDMVHSFLTLQHVPDDRQIIQYLFEFVRVAKRGTGIIVFQLPSKLPLSLRFKVRRPLYYGLRALGASPKFLYRVLRLNPMAMRAIPVERVVMLLSPWCEFVEVDHPDSVNTTYFLKRLEK